VDPTGKFAYVVNAVSNSVGVPHRRERGPGADLGFAGSQQGVFHVQWQWTPTGKFAYVVNEGDGNVSRPTKSVRTGP
jgi:DNA-binding beta-propeller fold protein YncE